jgi:hypothetical protein
LTNFPPPQQKLFHILLQNENSYSCLTLIFSSGGRVGAGDGYSVFVSDSGMMMSCGDGTFGCLGHCDWNNSIRPRLIGECTTLECGVYLTVSA